ncbi:hypothetical protein [Prochlorococcus sp. MIT 0604]|uniref:hypothetical protein n=1 Tax=Prochlorococcus sp. MIT 0604 TaxID=1501268 RepID=UPI0012DFF90D|nr:hypothetical protein [Prochlorococcus sp. MIT 0604]
MIKKFYFDRKNLKNLESKQKDLLIEFYESGKDFIKFKREPYVRQLEQKNYLIRDSKNFYRLNGNIMRLLKDNPSLLDPSDKEQIYEKLTADEKNLAMSFIKDLQHMNRLVEEVTAAKIRIREKEKNEDIFWKDKLLNKLRDYKIVFNNKYFYEDSTTDYPLRQWFKTLIEKEYEGKDFGEFIVI